MAPQEPKERRTDPRGREGGDRVRRRALLLCALALPLLIGFYALVVWRFQPHSPGHQLRIDEFTAAVREGSVQDATIRLADDRIVGNDLEGRYWVGYSDEGELVFNKSSPS